jgi:uridine phosphorylase
LNPNAPILEFDLDRKGLLEPSERFQAGQLPERLVISFFPEAIVKLAERSGAKTALRLQTCGTPRPPVHVFQRDGQDVAVFESGIGAPLAAGFLEELIALGARKVLVCGGAGVLDKALSQGHLILPSSAIRDEGLSYHYLPPSREVGPGAGALAALERVLKARSAPFVKGKTWTTDGLYRETKAKIAARKVEGALAVEMEAAAFFAVAQYRGIQLAQLLYAGDDVSGETWDHRGWNKNFTVQEMMLEICVEAVLSL